MSGSCARCGVEADDQGGDGTLPLGWSLSSSSRGVEWLCDRCTREHVRDIEAKLDETWWG